MSELQFFAIFLLVFLDNNIFIVLQYNSLKAAHRSTNAYITLLETLNLRNLSPKLS